MKNQPITYESLNTLCIGGSASGKISKFVAPSILQSDSSFVVTDPAGALYKKHAQYFKNNGYKVKCLNFCDAENSNHYNPFDYIRNDRDIESLVKTLIRNTNPPGQKSGDPFWEASESALLTALIAFLFHHSTKEMQNFSNVMKLMKSARVDEWEALDNCPLNHLFNEVEEKEGETFAVKQFKIFKMGASKNFPSILISCAVRIQMFDIEPVVNLTHTDDLELDRIGDEKTALFVIFPPGDTTFSFLTSIMYSQLLKRLFDYAENTAEFGYCIVDSDNQVWKTFRAQNEVDAIRAQNEAEAFFERAKEGKVIFNEDSKLWEILTDKNELVGYRGTKESAEEAFENLKNGKVIANCKQSNDGHRPPIHVKLIFDEFTNIGIITDFVMRAATNRKYQISFVLIIQSLQQLKSMYTYDWETIVGNCHSIIYLSGGTDSLTTEFISKLIVRTLPQDKCIIMRSGKPAFVCDKDHLVDSQKESV